MAYPRPVPGGILAVSATVGAEQLLGCTPAKELVTNDCSVTFILHFSVYSRGIRLLHITYGNHKTLPTAYHCIVLSRDTQGHVIPNANATDRSFSVLIIIDNWIYIS